jgi:signal transduction histidine kinase
MPHEDHLRRKPDRGLVGGVCVGLADYLGIEPLVARAAMLGVAAASGIGIVLYPLAWALIPASERRPWSWRRELTRWREAAAIAVFTVAALFALRRLGLWLGDIVVWPLIMGSCGLALIVRQVTGPEADESVSLPATSRPLQGASQDAPRRRSRGMPWRRWPAGVFGTVLVMAAAVIFLRDAGVLPLSGHALAGTSVLLVALALIVAPFRFAQARRLSRERMQRIRSEERAEMAAHLHDSVLQTLALIQRQAEDPAQVVGLARAQERELRDWLLARDGAGADAVSLRAGLERAAEEVEALHAVRIETVVVGDCPLDSRLTGLVAAAREALTNAAKFAGVSQVDLYAEAGEERVELFVRDRGVGFDPGQIPDDRQGIRRSIRERMDRHGGQAFVRSAPGEGTEVELAMQRSRA